MANDDKSEGVRDGEGGQGGQGGRLPPWARPVENGGQGREEATTKVDDRETGTSTSGTGMQRNSNIGTSHSEDSTTPSSAHKEAPAPEQQQQPSTIPPPPPRPSYTPTLSSPYPVPTSIPRHTLLTDLKRLSYILSLLLGSSAILALFWSAFILPRLHSTFSARGVLIQQQVERVRGLVDGLRALRRCGLYPKVQNREQALPGRGGGDGRLPVGEVEIQGKGEADGEERMLITRRQSGIEEIESSQSGSSISSSAKKRKAQIKNDPLAHPDPDSNPDSETDTPPPHPLPITSLSTLSQSLSNLSNAISSTSTTRQSLLSTLEGYTSHLHREVYLRSDQRGGGAGAWGVGLGSLGQNLASAGAGKVNGANGAGGTGGVNGKTDWDDVRREIRAVKGLLLGRRSLLPATTVAATNGSYPR